MASDPLAQWRAVVESCSKDCADLRWLLWRFLSQRLQKPYAVQEHTVMVEARKKW